MDRITWREIDSRHGEFPDSRAKGVDDPSIRGAAERLGVPFPVDYAEFLLRCGGGEVGAYSIAGLSRWESAADDNWNVEEQTRSYREQRYPGAERWVIFTDDGFGNPIGFDETGRIWLSDHNSRELVGLELTFERWLRAHALEIEAPSEDYFARIPWPKDE